MCFKSSYIQILLSFRWKFRPGYALISFWFDWWKNFLFIRFSKRRTLIISVWTSRIMASKTELTTACLMIPPANIRDNWWFHFASRCLFNDSGSLHLLVDWILRQIRVDKLLFAFRWHACSWSIRVEQSDFVHFLPFVLVVGRALLTCVSLRI